MFKTLVICVFFASASAIPAGLTSPHGQKVKSEISPYAYEYAVKDNYYGVDFGQNEESDGSVVEGSYRVLLPDGRVQTVKYTADHYNGYVADVSYSGDAVPFRASSKLRPASRHKSPAPTPA